MQDMTFVLDKDDTDDNIFVERYLSSRYKLVRYLHLTVEEILENDRMWEEENTTRKKV